MCVSERGKRAVTGGKGVPRVKRMRWPFFVGLFSSLFKKKKNHNKFAA